MAGFSLFSDLINPTSYQVPDWQAIDPTVMQQQAVAGNLATFGGASQLASQYNDFMRSQLARANQAAIPGFAGITNAIAQNIQAGLQGQLTSSDLAAQQRMSGAAGLGAVGGGGGPQSGFSQFLTARDIGATQQALKTQAQAQAQGFLPMMAGLARGPMYDPAQMFFSPQQRMAAAFQNQSNQWNVQNLKNQLAVQPAPWEKALAGFGDSLLTAAGSYLTMGTGNFSSPSSGGGGMFGDMGMGAPRNFGGFGNPQFNMGDQAAINYYLGG